ncbi:uncharacterized protein [Montipora foliosa]|uniref:uncharacterized protein n=1 Tax=Montipora foliosa TaxID=591990 RepID=UPI0035F13A54
MYHRILIPEEDQNVHGFLWRSMEIDRNPDTYLKTVLTFGDKPAPAMAQIALRKKRSRRRKSQSECTKDTERKQLHGRHSGLSANYVRSSAADDGNDEVFAKGGFRIKEWQSNRDLKDTGDKQNEEVNVPNGSGEDKVLGIVWNSTEDSLKLKVKSETIDCLNSSEWTKRSILSQIARIYDPVGFAAAFLIRAKIGFQELWQQKWLSLFKEMKELNEVSFPRSLSPPEPADSQPTLCAFADASQDAFGSCAYIKWAVEKGKFYVRFIAAKSRVAPLKEITIPRLKLQAAVLASRVQATINEESRFQLKETVIFTDSAIVLAWVRGKIRRYKPFVSRRIGEIQSQTDPGQWKHIPSRDNVADDVSRGIVVTELSGRWQSGPDFLRLPKEQWPQSEPEPNQEGVEIECRKTLNVGAVAFSPTIVDSNRFSSWKKLVRVMTWVLRMKRKFLAKIKQTNESQICQGPLSAQELEEGRKHVIIHAQRSLQNRLVNNEFKMLSPFVDDEGIIRVGGRVDKAIVSYEIKHPVLLPHDHIVSRLIIQEAHREMEPNTETQIMAALPQHRTAPDTPPFYYTSCDYFGPFTVKIGRNKTAKYYGVIFTCLNTRAVHLEIATDCSTMEFIQTLRRFFSIRGYPAMMISDNGAQMVGAQRELRKTIEGWDIATLREYCADKGIQWKFTTPGAPHHNGCAEALVKSCKTAIKKAVGNHTLTPFELYTCLLEVANLVNQRPIGRVPNDPDDGAYLCPNDML